MIIISKFFFCHNVFKSRLLQKRQKAYVCGNKVKIEAVIEGKRVFYFVTDMYLYFILMLDVFLPHSKLTHIAYVSQYVYKDENII